jgi:large subunit ribosomal protein L18
MVAHEKVIRKQRIRRKRRVRKPLHGTPDRPRLTVHRTNKHIYCQLVDDVARKTLCSASTRDKELSVKTTGNIDAATAVGKALAEKAKGAGIAAITFDRGPYKYHGRVKAVAEAAREAGLNL